MTHSTYAFNPQPFEQAYTAAQTRELDRLAIAEMRVTGFELMSRAGQAAFQCLLAQWPQTRQLLVFAGTGNNGGDGLVLATLAQRAGLPVTVVMLADTEKLRNEALSAFQQLQAQQVPWVSWQTYIANPDVYSADVLVDAMLGTGLQGDLRQPYRDAIAHINQLLLPIFSLDVPSGLCADTGKMLGQAVQAQLTLSFIGVNQGLLTGLGPACCGRLLFDSLAVVESVYAQLQPASRCITAASVQAQLPPRPRDAHKGHFGHVLVVGGDKGLGGAAAMAAEAAARCGAGLISVVTRPAHVSAIMARRPEIMVLGCDEGADISPLLAQASVVVVGPGLGRESWGANLIQQVLATDLPLVMDADALNYLAEANTASATAMQRHNWVLTPHPGEAARLLDRSTPAIQQDRFAALQALVAAYGGVALLKGAGTLVVKVGVREISINTTGNPGMASGGMGDVLSGVLGALIAQGLPLFDAACAAVWLHGKAADQQVNKLGGERGLLATDLMLSLQNLVNPKPLLDAEVIAHD